MNNLEGVIQVLAIGLIVASFLLNTSRFLKAIELCKECLFILKERFLIKDEKLTKSFYGRIYFIMWKAYSRINDDENSVKCAEKLLQIYHESGDRLMECNLSIKLGRIYFRQSKYSQAVQVYERALVISKEIGGIKKNNHVTEVLELCIHQLANTRRLDEI